MHKGNWRAKDTSIIPVITSLPFIFSATPQSWIEFRLSSGSLIANITYQTLNPSTSACSGLVAITYPLEPPSPSPSLTPKPTRTSSTLKVAPVKSPQKTPTATATPTAQYVDAVKKWLVAADGSTVFIYVCNDPDFPYGCGRRCVASLSSCAKSACLSYQECASRYDLDTLIDSKVLSLDKVVCFILNQCLSH